jgi:hypothetical protein
MTGLLMIVLAVAALLFALHALMADTAVAIHQEDGSERYVSLPLAAVSVAAGQGITITTATGYAGDAGDDAGTVTAGVFEPAGGGDEDQLADNSGGAAGDLSIRVRTRGLAKFGATAPDVTWLGQPVYWSDNQTVELAATTVNDILAGYVRKFDTAAAWVVIELAGLGRVNP